MNEEETRQILRERAIRLARTDAPEPVAQQRIVIFGLGGERYGLDIDNVVEIFSPETITPVPGARNAIQGVTNLRGDIVTVINLAAVLGLAGTIERGGRQVILAAQGTITAGLLVDEILGIWDIPAASIDPPLNTIEKIRAEHLLGEFKVADNLVGLLNVPNLLEAGNDA